MGVSLFDVAHFMRLALTTASSTCFAFVYVTRRRQRRITNAMIAEFWWQ